MNLKRILRVTILGPLLAAMYAAITIILPLLIALAWMLEDHNIRTEIRELYTDNARQLISFIWHGR